VVGGGGLGLDSTAILSAAQLVGLAAARDSHIEDRSISTSAGRHADPEAQLYARLLDQDGARLLPAMFQLHQSVGIMTYKSYRIDLARKPDRL
jgi:hypothetical protein